jgi:hypothetical protein
MGVVDVEIARVDFVHAETAVEVRQGCHAGADPADVEGGVAGLVRALRERSVRKTKDEFWQCGEDLRCLRSRS